MKFLKYLFITLLVLLGLWCLWAAFLPSVLHVENVLFINADAKTAFENVNTLKTWKQWSYWDNIDSAMKSEYSGPESGVGAIHKWESANDMVGKGSLEITKSEPGALVETKLTFEGMGEHMGGWKFKDSAGGVLVTAYMDMNNSFFFRPMMALFGMEKTLAEDFGKSLDGLKKLSESAPRIAAVPMEEVTQEVQKVVTLKGKCLPGEVSMKLAELYGAIGQFTGKNKISQAGPVFAIYTGYSDTAVYLEAGVPVDKLPAKTEGDIQAYETKGGAAYKSVYMGGYHGLYMHHGGITEWQKQNNLDIHAPRWEVYVTDPGAEPDSSKWITEIYIPK